jgi:hypothetical protein
MFLNKTTADIRLNDEVKVEAIVRLKPEIQKQYGEPVYESELQDKSLKN